MPVFAVPTALVGVTVKLSVPLPLSPNVPMPLVPETPVIGISVFGTELPIAPVPVALDNVPVCVSKLSVPVPLFQKHHHYLTQIFYHAQ